MALPEGTEQNLLTMLCWSDEYAGEIARAIPPRLFSTRAFRTIAEAAQAHYKKYSKAPGVHLADALEEQLRAGVEGQVLENVLAQIQALAAAIQPRVVLDQLEAFVRLQALRSALEEATDAVARGDADAAHEALYKPVYARGETPGIWLHDTDQLLGFMDEEDRDVFSSGVGALDRLDIRPARKELFVCLAPKKTGKTWWLIAMAIANMMQHRRRVLHISLEMDEDQIARRYVQAMLAMSVREADTLRVPVFKRDQLGRCVGLEFDSRTATAIKPEARAAIARRLHGLQYKPPLLIKAFPSGTLTVTNLKLYLDILEKRDRFRPDLIMIDYPRLMEHKVDNLRLSLGQTLVELRGIGIERNAAMVTPAQGSRLAETAKVVTSSLLNEDFSAAQTADTLCALMRSKAERDLNLARIYVDAARNAEDKHMVLITQNLAVGQFCLDSVYMSKHVEQAINRAAGKAEEEDEAEAGDNA